LFAWNGLNDKDAGQVETSDSTEKLRIAYPTLIDFRIANPEEREDRPAYGRQAIRASGVDPLLILSII
jgi:hypothetical protein